ncbi:unnamed protein product [Brassica rapa]|uniref:Uncharacterized protein n=1 Tax=Brassica campestris TaxID=3711 RepID=A0A8D9GXV6_BRACM|nr:unnamed protein product [Brassica rapa]
MDPKDKGKDVGTPKYTSKEPKVIVGKNCLNHEDSKPRKMGDVEGHEPSGHVPPARCAVMCLRRDAPSCASGEMQRHMHYYAGVITLTTLLSSSVIP